MKLKNTITALSLSLTLFVTSANALATEVNMQLIRNATVKLSFGDTTFLVDPLLAEPSSYPGFEDTYRSNLRNPLTPLPMSVDKVLKGVDAVIVTHTHLDHWDDAAVKYLPKNIPLLVQNKADLKLVRSQGFTNARILDKQDKFESVSLTRTPCRHGSEKMMADPVVGPSLGSVMGIIFRADDAPSVYLAADTVYYDGVEKVLDKEKPDYIILNTGGASLTLDAFADDPEIIMDEKDVSAVHAKSPQSYIIAVHMDAINHMTVDRKDLSAYVNEQGLRDKVFIPFDGEQIRLK